MRGRGGTAAVAGDEDGAVRVACPAKPFHDADEGVTVDRVDEPREAAEIVRDHRVHRSRGRQVAIALHRLTLAAPPATRKPARRLSSRHSSERAAASAWGVPMST